MTTLADIIHLVAEDVRITKTHAEDVTKAVLAHIAKNAAEGNDLNVAGFGQFRVKHTAARDGRNPATGAPIKIAASRKLAFVPAKALKEAMNA